MAEYSAQGSITVKRLRTGDSFFISLTSDNALFQGVDTATGAVNPDWTKEDNQPLITPQVSSSRGNAVTLSGHQWTYNGVKLEFTGDGPWQDDKTGKFRLNVETGALRIVQNLASKDNVAGDTLVYSCVARVAGVEYNLTKSVDIQIQGMGASSYYGTITATTEQLTADKTSATLTTKLYLGMSESKGYSVKWYKDDEVWSGKSGNSISVSRSDVDGTQLVIAEFYPGAEAAGSPVFRAGLRITDTLDDFHIEHRYVTGASGGTTAGANREVDTGRPVYVQAYVVNVRTNSEVTISGSWKMNIMDKDGWEVIATETGSGSNCTATVTTAHTDRGGSPKDVEVVSEVTWS